MILCLINLNLLNFNLNTCSIQISILCDLSLSILKNIFLFLQKNPLLLRFRLRFPHRFYLIMLKILNRLKYYQNPIMKLIQEKTQLKQTNFPMLNPNLNHLHFYQLPFKKVWYKIEFFFNCSTKYIPFFFIFYCLSN